MASWVEHELAKRSGELDLASKDFLSRGLDVFGKGGDLFGRGVDVLGKPLSYYESLLGSRQEALSAAAPEVSSIQGQFDTAARAVSEFSPRGGGRVSQSAELPFTKQAAIQDVLTKQRPAAAQGITDIGSLLAGLGLSQEQIGNMLSSLGLQEQGQSLQALLGTANVHLGQASQSAQTMSGLGTAAGSIIAAVLI